VPDPIDYANQQANEWKSKYERLRTALRQEREGGKAGKSEADALRAENATLKAAAAAAPGELQAAYDALKSEVRTDKHKAAFRAAALKSRVPEAAVDDLFAASGYTPEGDTPDPAKLGAFVQAAADARPWMLTPPVEAIDVKPSAPQAPPSRLTSVGAGGGRGALEITPGKLRVSRSRDLTSGAWASDKVKHDEYRAAIRNGTVEYVD
jgi:hypothetical protein